MELCDQLLGLVNIKECYIMDTNEFMPLNFRVLLHLMALL